ncbi:MAG TPA: DinB family protein [Candidatus Dormibacteraeota bacterium]
MDDLAYAIRHNLWATRRVLEFGRTLSADQLELTVEGTAGSIRYGLVHIVSADQRYLAAVGVTVTPKFQEAADSDLAQALAAHAANEQAWEALLAAPLELDRWHERPERHDRLRRVMIPAQAVHHGTDHRTQVGTILLHHGLELPDLSVWSYAAEHGDYQRDEGRPA